jgi:hypothetical protein
MDHDIGVLQAVLNEIDSLWEISGEIKTLMIFTRDLQVERNF